jgi:hypothetical protein
MKIDQLMLWEIIVVISEIYEKRLNQWGGQNSLLMLQQVVGTATTGL